MKEKSTNEDLKRSLLSLPVIILGKVELWLTYKGLKPVSAITLETNFSDLGEMQKKKLKEWLKKANLYHFMDQEEDRVLHVSKRSENAELSSRILWSKNYEDIIEQGMLFGYPPEPT